MISLTRPRIAPQTTLLSSGHSEAVKKPMFGLTGGIEWPGFQSARVTWFDDKDQFRRIGGDYEPVKLASEGQNAETLLQGLARHIRIGLAQVLPQLPKTEPFKQLWIFVSTSHEGNIVPEYWNQSFRNMDVDQIKHLLAQSPSQRVPQEVIVVGDVIGGAAAATAALAQKYPRKLQEEKENGLSIVHLDSGYGLGVALATYNPHNDAFRIEGSDLASNKHDLRNKDMRFIFRFIHRILHIDNVQRKKHIGGDIHDMLTQYKQALEKLLWLRGYRSFPHDARTAAIYHNQDLDVVLGDIAVARKVLPGLSRNHHQKAVQRAVNDYIRSLAYAARIAVLNSHSNLVLVYGPIARQVITFVNQNPGLFRAELNRYKDVPGQAGRGGQTPFNRLFLEHMWNDMEPDAADRAQNLFRERGFDVISDIDVPDNTAGVPYLAKGRFLSPVWRDKVDIPVTALRQ